MCAMRGQAFLAETSIGQELASNERVKVMCVRHIPIGGRVTRNRLWLLKIRNPDISLAASYRWRHSWQHAIESHAATDGGFIPGGRRSRVLSHSHSGTLDIRTAVRCGRERRREIVIATRAAEGLFQRAQATRRRGAGPAFCGYPR